MRDRRARLIVWLMAAALIGWWIWFLLGPNLRAFLWLMRRLLQGLRGLLG